MAALPRPLLRRIALLLVAIPALTGCIEDHLTVDITTRVFPDGSCSRRIEYRLERIDTEKGGARVPLPPPEDSLIHLHRLPSGEAWSVNDRVEDDVHTVLAEATIASANDLDWDYWRVRAPKGLPARNHLSFAMEGRPESSPWYEYSETFLDPASPMAGARLLAQLLVREEDAFASALERRLGERRLRRNAARRVFHDTFALPFSREVKVLAERAVYGPRERQLLEGLLDRIDGIEKDLDAALLGLAPGVEAEEMKEAVDAVMEELSPRIGKTVENAGLPFPAGLSERTSIVRFRATLIMPGPIVRANTCVQGDTAVWEFGQDDLYGRGFDMWARTATP